jgi:hypothetical protein
MNFAKARSPRTLLIVATATAICLAVGDSLPVYALPRAPSVAAPYVPRSTVSITRSDTGIAGYADATSVNVGQTIHFMVSTASPTVAIHVYRVGRYGGTGDQLLVSVAIPGQMQGEWTPDIYGVANCPTCQLDDPTGMIDANWQPSFSLAVPWTWSSGSYFAKLTTVNGQHAYIFFVVRQDSRSSKILAIMPVNTYQAYNDWGGASLYRLDAHAPVTVAQTRAIKVSFNRPYSPHVVDPLGPDFQFARFLEQSRYDVTYATDVDVDRNPSLLLGHREYVAIGHDEYWSRQMWQTVQYGRDNGVNLAFLGGNQVYRQVRYEPDGHGYDRRTLVCYKSAALDPIAAVRPADATVEFKNPPLNRPENALTGTVYEGAVPPPPSGSPWVVAHSAPAWLLAGTGLVAGQSVPKLASYECDQAVVNGSEPAGLAIVGSSTFIMRNGKSATCDTTWYATPHHSEVFSAGTMGWTFILYDRSVMRMTQNILNRFSASA